MKSKKSLSKMLSEYHPIPSQRFYQKMETAPWHPKRKNMSNRSTRPFRFVWQMAIAVILVIVVLGLSIPAVRASLSAWLGLSVAPSNQMPAAPVTLVAVVFPLPIRLRKLHLLKNHLKSASILLRLDGISWLLALCRLAINTRAPILTPTIKC
jgi:hypothetical protein